MTRDSTVVLAWCVVVETDRKLKRGVGPRVTASSEETQIIIIKRPRRGHNVAKHPAMAALWPTLVVMGFQEPPRPPERAFSDYPTHIAHLHA